MTPIYITVAQTIRVIDQMSAAQFERCSILACDRPRGFRTGDNDILFRPSTESGLFALQNYLFEQGLAHRITNSREWRP